MQKTIPKNYCKMQDVNTSILCWVYFQEPSEMTITLPIDTHKWHFLLCQIVRPLQCILLRGTFQSNRCSASVIRLWTVCSTLCILSVALMKSWIVHVSCTTVASLLWPSLTEFVNGRFLPNRSRSSHRHGYGLQPRLSHPSAVQTWFSHSLKV